MTSADAGRCRLASTLERNDEAGAFVAPVHQFTRAPVRPERRGERRRRHGLPLPAEARPLQVAVRSKPQHAADPRRTVQRGRRQRRPQRRRTREAAHLHGRVTDYFYSP